MANISRILLVSSVLPTGGDSTESARPAVAAFGCSTDGRKSRRRSGVGLVLCRSSTAGAQGGRKMEDYNTAMKRMMHNPYECHHDLGISRPTVFLDKSIIVICFSFLEQGETVFCFSRPICCSNLFFEIANLDNLRLIFWRRMLYCFADRYLNYNLVS
jgi:hypothetical protein